MTDLQAVQFVSTEDNPIDCGLRFKEKLKIKRGEILKFI